MRLRPTAALALAVVLALAACGSEEPSADGSDDTRATVGVGTTSGTTQDDGSGVVAGEAFPDERCAANDAAGTITYLTGFDFAATASIVDVIVAEANGYYDDLCLDVEIVPSFSTANYPLVAENDAQFASGGSFSEVVAFADANDAEFVVTAVEGPTAIDSLILKPGVAADLGEVAGSTIGVKGKLPPSVAAMLATAGLVENEDYETVLLDGFDPTAHIAIDAIDGFPGYKSNEPGALERAGIDFDLFDPLDYDIPGSFGVVYGNAQFIAEHPTAAEDFMRATMLGLADAIADPEAAANTAVELINSGGNPNFLSPEGEVFRWSTDAALISELTPPETGFGVADVDALQNELDTYAEVGLFGDAETPSAAEFLSDVLDHVYDADATVIWPTGRPAHSLVCATFRVERPTRISPPT
jgi:ABC-type nitrate/sulfonate/bicarbonate transport system substrate-binding protein